MAKDRKTLIKELYEHADYLTDENYHSEASVISDIIEIVEKGKNDTTTLDDILEQLTRLSG